MTRQTKLRTLAKAYANGQIEKEKYRSDRAAYLEAVIAGEVDLPLNETTAIENGDTFNDITSKLAEKSRPRHTENDAAKSSQDRQKSVMIFGGIGLAVLIVILTFVFTGDEDAGQPASMLIDEGDTVDEILDAPPSPAQNLISAFLQENNWSEASMDSFLMNWNMLSESVRADAAGSTEYSQLVNAIYKKLLEERALSRIGNPQTAYEKQRQLVEFADTIGITDQRISLPDEPPADP